MENPIKSVWLMLQLVSCSAKDFPSINHLFLWKSVTGYVTILRTDLLLWISESGRNTSAGTKKWMMFSFFFTFLAQGIPCKTQRSQKNYSLPPMDMEKKRVWKMSLVSKMVIFHFHDCWKMSMNVEISSDFHGSENSQYPWEKSTSARPRFPQFLGASRW